MRVGILQRLVLVLLMLVPLPPGAIGCRQGEAG